MMLKSRVCLTVAAAAVPCLLALQQAAAVPTIDEVNVKQPSLTDFDIEPEFELSWAAGGVPEPGARQHKHDRIA